MKFSWFLALRYLKPKRTFLSIITVISILGVMLGVGVLIVVIAVMSGFEKRIKDEWLKVEPPLYLHDTTRRTFGEDEPEVTDSGVPVWRELLPKVKSLPGVVGASPYLNVVALIEAAPPKDFNDTVVAPPDSLPPPPKEPDGNAPPPGDEPARNKTPDSPEPASPGLPEPAEAAPASPLPVNPDPAAVPDPAASPEPPAADEPVPDETDEAEETEADRKRPLTHVTLVCVDTDDTMLVDKYDRRMKELAGRPRPAARGEFDVAGEGIVLSEDVVAKLFRPAVDPYPNPGETVYRLYGSKFIHEGIGYVQKHRKKKKSDADGGEVPGASGKDEDEQEMPAPEELTMNCIFNDDKLQASGADVGYISLKTGQRLAGAGQRVDGIFVDMDDPYDAPAMARRITESGLLPAGWKTETWIERHRQQFEAVANERSMMYIVLGFISLVAAFCIMNTMITMAVQKRREIGMMRALGAKTTHIIGIFMTKGFIVGLVGVSLGYAAGRTVLHFRNGLRDWINDSFGHQIFDAQIYGLNEIPADLRGMDELLICAIAFVLCTLAAVPPAWMVGRMEPARALRNDR